MSKRAVFCSVATFDPADRVVEQVKTADFSPDVISVLSPDTRSTRDVAQEKNTNAPKGVGGVRARALDRIAGIGALANPGVGPFIGAGPIVAALSGAAVGSALAGIVGDPVGIGIPESEAKRHEGEIKAGNIQISVHTRNAEEIATATDTFTKAGAETSALLLKLSTPRKSRACIRLMRDEDQGVPVARLSLMP